MNSTSTIQSVSSSSSVAISGSSVLLTSLITPASSSFAAVGATPIEPIISTATSSAETATDNVSLSSVIIESDRQASPSAASPMSNSGVRADMSSTPASTSVTTVTTQATTTSVPVAAPPNTNDSSTSTSTISSSSSSQAVITASSTSFTVQAPPSTSTVTSTQPGATVTTTDPGTTNDAPTTSVATGGETPVASAEAITATVTEQSGATVTGPSNNGNGDNSGTFKATGIADSSVNLAATTVSTVHSTLPQAIGVTVTGSDGQTSVTFPSFVTVLSTATESNGTVVTESAVVSNPTGLGQPDTSSNSFFNNTSAVAGTFAAVGIVVFAVLALLFACYRRRRRQRERTRWLAAITQPPSYPLHDDDDRDPFEEEDPFSDSRNLPQMAQVTNTPQTTYTNKDQRHDDSEHGDTEDSTSHLLGVRNFAAASLGTGPTTRIQEEGPFSDVNAFSPQEAIGLAITTNYPVPPSLHSRQSTPSLYSDPPQVNGDTDSFYDVDLQPPVPPKTETRPAPPPIPRPPRSILRGTPPSSQFRGSEYRPLTPPDSLESQRLSLSSSSGGPSTPTGLGFATGSSLDHEPAKLANPLAPTLSPAAILTRRTLLDIRPRPSHDNVLTDASGRV